MAQETKELHSEDELQVKKIKLEPGRTNGSCQTSENDLDNMELNLAYFECSFSECGNVSTQISMSKSQITRNKCKFCCKKQEKPDRNPQEKLDNIPPLILLPTAVPPLIFRSNNPKTYTRKTPSPQSGQDKSKSEALCPDDFLNIIRDKLQGKIEESEESKKRELERKLMFPKNDNPKTYSKNLKTNFQQQFCNYTKSREMNPNVTELSIVKEEPKDDAAQEKCVLEPEFVDCHKMKTLPVKEETEKVVIRTDNNENLCKTQENQRKLRKKKRNEEEDDDILIVKNEIKIEQDDF